MRCYVLRNRTTGALLSKVDYGEKVPAPIDADDYRPPRLFTEHNFDAACAVMKIDPEQYEKVRVELREVRDGEST